MNRSTRNTLESGTSRFVSQLSDPSFINHVLQSSVFVREWALTRWPENTQVSLADELPALKAESRAAREGAIAAGEFAEL